MATLRPLLMRRSDYRLHIRKRQGWEKACSGKKGVRLVLFPTGDHDIGSLRRFVLPSLLFIDIAAVLFTYDRTWLLSVN